MQDGNLGATFVIKYLDILSVFFKVVIYVQ